MVSNNRKSILDKISSVDKSVKNRIKEQEKEEIIIDKPVGRQVDDEVLYFEIAEDDDEFLTFIKEEINKAKMSKSDLYKIYDRPEAYNMIYTLKQGTLSIPRLKKWLKALGKDIVITTVDNN